MIEVENKVLTSSTIQYLLHVKQVNFCADKHQFLKEHNSLNHVQKKKFRFLLPDPTMNKGMKGEL